MATEWIALLMFSSLLMLMLTGQRMFGIIGFVAVVAALWLWGERGGYDLAFAQTIKEVHEAVPGCSVEVLVPDLQGNEDSNRLVLEARPVVGGAAVTEDLGGVRVPSLAHTPRSRARSLAGLPGCSLPAVIVAPRRA